MFLSVVSGRTQHSVDTTLYWLNGVEIVEEVTGNLGDYFFQYYVPEADGYIRSFDFNFSNLPDVTGCGLAIWVFSTNYMNWQEIETSVIADSCGAGQLGYYLNSGDLSITEGEWVRGGINTTMDADPEFNYDPILDQMEPSFGSFSMSVEPNGYDEGIFSINLMESSTTYNFFENQPLALVVRISCQQNLQADSAETAMAFNAAEMIMNPQPCLKFFNIIDSPEGRCGVDDWGWYIQRRVLDWSVNVTYSGVLDVELNPQVSEKTKQLNILSVSPNPANPILLRESPIHCLLGRMLRSIFMII